MLYTWVHYFISTVVWLSSMLHSLAFLNHSLYSDPSWIIQLKSPDRLRWAQGALVAYGSAVHWPGWGSDNADLGPWGRHQLWVHSSSPAIHPKSTQVLSHKSTILLLFIETIQPLSFCYKGLWWLVVLLVVSSVIIQHRAHNVPMYPMKVLLRQIHGSSEIFKCAK